ncbi:MAG: hypothetical protein P4L84_25385 [Isosphaeraceae bacterium]|nr:hypothetical protein [Isosphaeraceae bacterium]
MSQREDQWPPGALDAWVRARIPRLFEFTPPRCVNNVSALVNIAFVAVSSFERCGQMDLCPFVCSVAFHPEDDLQEEPLVGLFFSRRGPSRRVKARIADRFWSLLLKEPYSLEPFLDTLFHDYDGYVVGFDGETFISEPLFHKWEDGHVENHYAYLMGPLRWCEDCEGTGIEDTFPYLEDCATCRGAGSVTW